MRRMIKNSQREWLDKANENIAFTGTKTEIGGDAEIDGKLSLNNVEDLDLGQTATQNGKYLGVSAGKMALMSIPSPSATYVHFVRWSGANGSFSFTFITDINGTVSEGSLTWNTLKDILQNVGAIDGIYIPVNGASTSSNTPNVMGLTWNKGTDSKIVGYLRTGATYDFGSSAPSGVGYIYKYSF